MRIATPVGARRPRAPDTPVATAVGVARAGLWLVAIVATLAITTPRASADVGKASVVHGEPKGKPPDRGERILKIGNDLQANERVTTTANDRAHVVFLDGTSLTVGPNSVVVLDKFVFDPNRGVGEMSLSTLKGSMRFVGGLVSKTSTVTVTAPTSTMGIRGGIAIVIVGPSDVTTAALLFGVSLTVTSEGVTQTATPNFQITVEPGKPPSPPVPIPPGGPIVLAALDLAAPSSPAAPGDAQGAAQRVAIAVALADSGLPQVNSGISPEVAIANLIAQQQAQWSFGIGVRLGAGAGPARGTTPLASSGPLQGGDPLTDGGPLHTMGPLQASGPLQGMGPLISALPLQDMGPVPIPELPGTVPGQLGPLVSLAPSDYQPPSLTPEQISTLASGNVAAINQLVAQLLTNGQATPETIQQVINIVSSSAATPFPSAISQPTGITGSQSTTPGSDPSVAPSAPSSGVLPPAVFQPTTFVSGS
ncbi:MAG: FecR domain-containing protein [Geminicoccaceae bacterium]|uniref:FecR family protein n=1 Tax=Reyranella sp. TaxID=1929291 RepID=UPI003D0D424D